MYADCQNIQVQASVELGVFTVAEEDPPERGREDLSNLHEYLGLQSECRKHCCPSHIKKQGKLVQIQH